MHREHKKYKQEDKERSEKKSFLESPYDKYVDENALIKASDLLSQQETNGTKDENIHSTKNNKELTKNIKSSELELQERKTNIKFSESNKIVSLQDQISTLELSNNILQENISRDILRMMCLNTQLHDNDETLSDMPNKYALKIHRNFL